MILVLTAGTAICQGRAKVLFTDLLWGTVRVSVVADCPASIRPRGVGATVADRRLVRLILYRNLVVLPPVQVILFFMIGAAINDDGVEVPRPFAVPI